MSRYIPLLQKIKFNLLKFCCKLKFLFVLFSVKPENVQLLTNTTANNTCPGGYWNYTCSVGAANPQVTSYQLLENDIAVDTSSSGMWIRTLSNSGVFTYKCLANNTVGSTISANEKNITVAGNDFTSLYCSLCHSNIIVEVYFLANLSTPWSVPGFDCLSLSTPFYVLCL